MRLGTVTAKVVAGVLVVVLTGCVADGEPGPSRSLSPDASTSATAAPGDTNELDGLIAACDDDITPQAETAAVAARRSMGVADPDEEEGTESGDERAGSTTEAARTEARRAARTASGAVTACLERTTEVAADAGPTPDRRLVPVQSRLRELSRALRVLELALQEGEAVHEPANAVLTALVEWRRLAGPRPRPSGSPDATEAAS